MSEMIWGTSLLQELQSQNFPYCITILKVLEYGAELSEFSLNMDTISVWPPQGPFVVGNLLKLTLILHDFESKRTLFLMNDVAP